MIRFEINQSLLKGGERFPEKKISDILRVVGRIAKIKKYDVSIAFVDEKTIRFANRIYRKKDSVTDVLSFSFKNDIGELLIYYSQARRQAKQFKHSVRREITFLIVHGMLHLFGYDHEKSKDTIKMFELQKKIMDNL